MSISHLSGGICSSNNWKEKYEGPGFRRQVSEICPERSKLTLKSPEVTTKTSTIIPTMDLIGTDTRDRWSYRMYDDINTRFSRPNSASIRGPPYAHPKDKLPSSPV